MLVSAYGPCAAALRWFWSGARAPEVTRDQGYPLPWKWQVPASGIRTMEDHSLVSGACSQLRGWARRKAGQEDDVQSSPHTPARRTHGARPDTGLRRIQSVLPAERDAPRRPRPGGGRSHRAGDPRPGHRRHGPRHCETALNSLNFESERRTTRGDRIVDRRLTQPDARHLLRQLLHLLSRTSSGLIRH